MGDRWGAFRLASVSDQVCFVIDLIKRFLLMIIKLININKGLFKIMVDCINSSASGYTPISVSTLRWAIYL